MAYSYNINTSKRDKCSSVCLFFCHAMIQIINLFLNTFLVAQIYYYVNGVNDYIFKMCIFIGVTYLCMGLAMIPFSHWVERSNRVWPYRVGIMLRTALVIVSIFFGKNLSQMLVLAGALNGISNAAYYAGYNTIKHEMVSRKFMRGFTVISQIGQLVVTIIIPVVMGKLIDISTFSQVSFYVLVICAIQIALSFGVKAKRPEGSKFDLKDYFKKLKQQPEAYQKIKYLYVGALIYGCTTIVTNLLNICIMMEYGSNFGLGAISSIFSVVSMVTILIVNKWSKAGKRSALYIISAILPFVCTVLFAIWPNVWALILFNLGTAISGIIFKTIYDIYRNGILKEAGLYSEITEHQALVEILLCVTRVITHGLVLLLALLQSLVLFKIILCISVLSYSGIIIFLLIYENKFIKNKNGTEKVSPAQSVEQGVEDLDNNTQIKETSVQTEEK